jgi:hypothetical protein
MIKLFKFIKDGKVVGVSYTDYEGNIETPEGAIAIEISENEKEIAISRQISDAASLMDKTKNQEERIVDLEKRITALEDKLGKS